MPNWITLSADDLKPYLVAAQVAALRTAALGPGQADPFTEVAPDLVRKVRAYIASNPENQVDASPLTFPAELKLDVTYLIIAPLLGRLGIPLTKDQVDAVERAQSTLLALRDQKLLVSKPDSPIAPDVQGGPGVEQASSAPRRATAKNLSGL